MGYYFHDSVTKDCDSCLASTLLSLALPMQSKKVSCHVVSLPYGKAHLTRN